MQLRLGNKDFESVYGELSRLPNVPGPIINFFGEDLVRRMGSIFRAEVFLEADAHLLAGTMSHRAVTQANQAFEEYREAMAAVLQLAKDCAAVVEARLPELIESYKGLLTKGSGLVGQRSGETIAGRRSLRRKQNPKKRRTMKIQKPELNLGQILNLANDLEELFGYLGQGTVINSRLADFRNYYTSRLLCAIKRLIHSGTLAEATLQFVNDVYYPQLKTHFRRIGMKNPVSCAENYEAWMKGQYEEIVRPIFDEIEALVEGDVESLREENEMLYEEILEQTVYKALDDFEFREGNLRFIIPWSSERAKAELAFVIQVQNIRDENRIGQYNVQFYRHSSAAIFWNEAQQSFTETTGEDPIVEEKMKSLIFKAILEHLWDKQNDIEDLLIDASSAIHSGVHSTLGLPTEILDTQEEMSEEIESALEQGEETDAENLEKLIDEVIAGEGSRSEADYPKRPSKRQFHAIPFRRVLRGFNHFGVEKLRNGKHPIYKGPNGLTFAISARSGGDTLGSAILFNALNLWGIDPADFLRVVRSAKRRPTQGEVRDLIRTNLLNSANPKIRRLARLALEDDLDALQISRRLLARSNTPGCR